MNINGDSKLVRIYKSWLKHERLRELKSKKVYIDWKEPQAFEKGWEVWAYSWHDAKGVWQVRLNELLKRFDAPEGVVAYVVAHEMIHALPGCNLHNDTFWDHEITIMGEDYYKCTVWLRKHKGIFWSRYEYRSKGWLRKMIQRDQLRVKDMAEICGCSERTIRRWLKKYDLSITKR